MRYGTRQFSLFTISLIGWLGGLVLYKTTVLIIGAVGAAFLLASLSASFPGVIERKRLMRWLSPLLIVAAVTASLITRDSMIWRLLELMAAVPLIILWLAVPRPITASHTHDDQRTAWIILAMVAMMASVLVLVSRPWPLLAPILFGLVAIVVQCMSPEESRSIPRRISPTPRWLGLLAVIDGFGVAEGFGSMSTPMIDRLDWWSLTLVIISVIAAAWLYRHRTSLQRANTLAISVLLWDLLAHTDHLNLIAASGFYITVFIGIIVLCRACRDRLANPQAPMISRFSYPLGWPLMAFGLGWQINGMGLIEHASQVVLAGLLLGLVLMMPRTTDETSTPIVNPISLTPDNTDGRFAKLTPQERRIVSLLVQGRHNPEIIRELYISINTLKTHLRNIYRKTHTQNRRELVQKLTMPPAGISDEYRNIR